MTRIALSLFTIFYTGCSDSIAPDTPDAATTPPAVFTTTRGADGTYTTIVDATSQTEWTHGDFETGMASTATGSWDLRFQRFHISTNGGVSGNGGVEVAPVPGVFDQVTSPPASGWLSDAADGDDENTDPEYAFEQGDGWFDYDPMTHKLTPKPLVWIVKTDGGAMLKLAIETYYDAAGTGGVLTLRWRPM